MTIHDGLKSLRMNFARIEKHANNKQKLYSKTQNFIAQDCSYDINLTISSCLGKRGSKNDVFS